MANHCQLQKLVLSWNATIVAISRTVIRSPVGARLKRFYRKTSCACGGTSGMFLT